MLKILFLILVSLIWASPAVAYQKPIEVLKGGGLSREPDSRDDYIQIDKLLEALPGSPSEKKMQNLFSEGRYKKAEIMLHQLQDTLLFGNDYGAVAVLIKKGDLDKALEIATMTISWPHVRKNNTLYSGIVCEYSFSSYPGSIDDLSSHFRKIKEYNKAEKAVMLLSQYIDHDLYGNNFQHCSRNYANIAELNAVTSLAKIFVGQGNSARALNLFKGRRDRIAVEPPKCKNCARTTPEYQKAFNNGLYMHLAMSIIDAGLEKEVLDFLPPVPDPETAVFSKPSLKEKFFPPRKSSISMVFEPALDIWSTVLYMAGKKDEAIARVEGVKNTDKQLQMLFHLEDELIEKDQKKDATGILEIIKKHDGGRNRAIDDVLDDVKIARLEFQVGSLEESRKYLKKAEIYALIPMDKDNEERWYNDSRAVVYAEYGEPFLHLISDKNNTQVFYLALLDFARNDQWDRFDAFYDKYKPLIKSGPSNSSYFEGNLKSVLLQKNQPERYQHLIE